jgi:hypothetical protein
MVPEDLPTLPSSPGHMQEILFPESRSARLPVLQWLFYRQSIDTPEGAAAYLAMAGNCPLSLDITFFLTRAVQSRPSTEMVTSMLVGSAITSIFGLLNRYSRHKCSLKIHFNSSESTDSSTSSAFRDNVRPDMLVAVSGCTVLYGEDKANSLPAASADLRRKQQPLSALHYGKVKSILAYAAAGSKFQWYYAGANGEVRCACVLLVCCHSVTCCWESKYWSSANSLLPTLALCRISTDACVKQYPHLVVSHCRSSLLWDLYSICQPLRESASFF